MSFHRGSFLVAKTSLIDPNFRRTVVLLVQHNEEGAFGLIVNRPVPVDDLKYPIYAGGPCQAEGLFLLHGHAEWIEEFSMLGAGGNEEVAEANCQVAPGIFVADSSCVEKVKDLEADEMERIRMFAGYAGWGPGQLESELLEEAWLLVPADGELLFEKSPEELWTHLKPPSIPQPSVN